MVRLDGEVGLSSAREPTTDSLLFHSAPMCYKLSVSLADQSWFSAVCRRINPDLRGSHDRQTVSSERIHRGNKLG